MKYEKPTDVEKLYILAIVVMGICGLALFYAAINMPTIEGPWQTITAVMSWINVMVLLVLGAELEGIRERMKRK
ncbi:hypothetical protein DRN62_01830 [Nanoarchaeota archaeon]|nr:hypothetical protein [Nanoarchaeota archaeon]RLG17201.1 MAG: hypothetical protein DRN62_01830 [Nanoarchaeota archaeon]